MTAKKRPRTSPSATSRERVAYEREVSAAKAALGLAPGDELPRCGQRSRAKAKVLMKAGDPSHMGTGHVCALCACQHTAGMGTNHFGVGWCWQHEKKRSPKQRKDYADKVTNLIRQGYPNRKFMYQSTSDNLNKIYKEAEASNLQIDMRDNQILVIDLVQRLLTYLEQGSKNGKIEIEDPEDPEKTVTIQMTALTESYKDGPGAASDITVMAMLDKLLNTQAKLSKTQLEITGTEYCHVDEVKVFFGQVMRIIQNNVSKEQMDIILPAVLAVEQPRPGKRGK